MTFIEPAAGPVDDVDRADDPPADDDGPATVRTSLKLRREVHTYFRERALSQKISLQQLLENLCEGAFHEWTQMNAARERRSNRG
jgi:hypothetical protein